MFDTAAGMGFEFSANEVALTSSVMTYWGQFVWNGNPNAPGYAPWLAHAAAPAGVMDLNVCSDPTPKQSRATGAILRHDGRCPRAVLPVLGPDGAPVQRCSRHSPLRQGYNY